MNHCERLTSSYSVPSSSRFCSVITQRYTISAISSLITFALFFTINSTTFECLRLMRVCGCLKNTHIPSLQNLTLEFYHRNKTQQFLNLKLNKNNKTDATTDDDAPIIFSREEQECVANEQRRDEEIRTPRRGIYFGPVQSAKPTRANIGNRRNKNHQRKKMLNFF